MSKFVEWLLTDCSLSVCVCVTLTHVMEPLGPSRKRWALEQDQVLNAGSGPFTRYKVPDVSDLKWVCSLASSTAAIRPGCDNSWVGAGRCLGSQEKALLCKITTQTPARS